MPRVITLLTDFGTQDSYVAEMKGVILGIYPEAQFVDITHQIPPQEVRAGARLLRRAVLAFPPKTIHLAIVDPGVGSARRPLVIDVDGTYLVGPDNGLLVEAAAALGGEAMAYELRDPSWRRAQVSPVFHGRDLFAPAVAHLARGLPAEAAGPAVDEPVWLPRPHLLARERALEGEIVAVDHFGNLLSSIPGGALPAAREALSVSIGGTTLHGLKRFYAEAQDGELLALLGSDGEVEIAQRGGSAARSLQIGAGARLVVSW